MELIKPNFKFKIANIATLSPDDIQSLTLLYQPIIGLDAFSLYTTLATLPPVTTHAHHLLLQLLDCCMEQLVKKRQRLEAAGLIKTYESDDLLTYVLKKPLLVNSFLSDGIMSAFLYVKVGAKDFALIKQMLTSDSEKLEGKHISKRFDEVFDIKMLTRVPHNLIAQGYDKNRSGIDIADNFDVSTLLSVLKKKGISQEMITQSVLTSLNELAFLYKFDVHELARLVFDSTDPAGVVDLVKMKSLARTQFQLMSKGEHVQVVVKDEKNDHDEALIETNQPSVIAFLEQNPIDFLRFKSGGKPPVPADIKLVEWLYLDQKMNAGVVNVLVDYVLDYADGNLPKQLVEKIAGQWQRQNVSTAQAAMDKVMKNLKKRNDYQKEKQQPIARQARNLNKATRFEPIPDWLGKSENLEFTNDAAAKERVEQIKRALTNRGVGDAKT